MASKPTAAAAGSATPSRKRAGRALRARQPAKRTGDWFTFLWGRSGQLLGFGLAVLLFAIGSTFYFLYEGRHQQRCAVTPADLHFPPPTDFQKPRILRVDPVEFQFDKTVCVIVDTAVSPETFNKLNTALQSTAAAASRATAAAAANVAQPQSATTPPPSQDQAHPPTVELQSASGTSLGAIQVTSQATVAAQAQYQAAQQALDKLRKGAVYRLYINGQPSTLKAHIEGRPDPQPLTFVVQPEEDARSANASYWRDILAAPSAGGKVPIEIGLGQEDAAAPIAVAPAANPANGTTAQISFVLFKPVVMWSALVGVLSILLGITGLAHGTALLREGISSDSAFSLSRVQMAFWLILSTAGFLYVWLVTGEYRNVFPAALFVLIGISGATAGAAQLMEAPSNSAPKSKNFMCDIAGNWRGGQMQLHRLQIIAWTAILGLIFCWNIVAKLQLTTFDTNLLILTGVANGVYVTLKPTENK